MRLSILKLHTQRCQCIIGENRDLTFVTPKRQFLGQVMNPEVKNIRNFCNIQKTGIYVWGLKIHLTFGLPVFETPYFY